MSVRRHICIWLLCAAACPAVARAQPPQDLKRLTIEELMRIDVTTVGRRPEPIGTTAAAASVITSDDIRRAGVTTIADALEMADGVHLARFNSGTWSISARGFNQNTPNKMLVMVDGRTVYSPLFAGVFWNTLDYVLEDIDRIEVIRGPGATLWGANAVNGIINIITRHARDTQGALVSIASGDEDPLIVEARYGGLAGAAAWRIYGKFAGRDDQRFTTGASAGDARRRGQGGFRIDGGQADATEWLVKGDAFHSRDSLPDRPDGQFLDLNLQARWSRALADESKVSIQSYYRREYRHVPQQLTHFINVFDVDAQHAGTWARRHAIVWGGGVRVNADTTHASPVIRFDPPSRTYPISNVFAQDEIALVPDSLLATVGVKWEHNAFSGGELQPSLRARLLIPHGQVLWGAVSRAVRRPTRFEDDIVVSASGLALARGDDDVTAELLTASELGYRVRPAQAVSFEATVFHHDFSDLRSQDLSPTGALPLVVGNSLEGTSRGVEFGVNIQPATWWRSHVNYTWLDTEVRRQPGSRDVGGGISEANDPHHLFNLRTSLDLPRNIEADVLLRSIGELPNPRVPAYTEINLRVGWRASPRVSVWVAGQDLLHDRHVEFGAATPTQASFERSLRIGITLRR
jgi:iron complex outermembrane receptor protein